MPQAQNKSGDIKRAVDEMFDMNKRALKPPAPPESKGENCKAAQQSVDKSINNSQDMFILLTLILILTKENCDSVLLFVLLYILS